MSWTDLTLASGWSVMTDYPAARVRPLSGISNAAELEGHLQYGGSSTVDVPLTGAAMPTGTFDTSAFHTVGGRWYTTGMASLGNTEILVGEDGNLTAVTVPSSAKYLIFGEVYPVS